MTDHDSFLQAICADREADLPRLAFADWLDEHDQPARAEFIRAQVKRFRLQETAPLPVVRVVWKARSVLRGSAFVCRANPPTPDDLPIGRLYHMVDADNNWTGRFVGDYRVERNVWGGTFAVCERPEAALLLKREAELFGSDDNPGGRRALWAEPLVELKLWNGRTVSAPNEHWERGFVSHLVVDANAWCEHAGALLAKLPLRVVTLAGLPQIKHHRGTRDDLYWLGAKEKLYTEGGLTEHTHAHPTTWGRKYWRHQALLQLTWPDLEFRLL